MPHAAAAKSVVNAGINRIWGAMGRAVTHALYAYITRLHACECGCSTWQKSNVFLEARREHFAVFATALSDLIGSFSARTGIRKVYRT